MFARVYRPLTFADMSGQGENIEVLRAIIANPEKAPRCIIMRGDYGCGKTTMARILARGLNCEGDTSNVPCGGCKVCTSSLDFTPYYQEYDSSDVGNKESMSSLKNDFFMKSSACKWRVIVFDEFHLTSRPAQGSLLKVLEEMPDNLFIVFATTDIHLVQETIRSRSVELVFRKLSLLEIKQNLMRIAKKEALEVKEGELECIAMASRGHVRDSVMLLDVYSLMKERSGFFDMLKSSELPIINLLKETRRGGDVESQIEKIVKNPLDTVREDFYIAMKNLIYAFAEGKIESFHVNEYRELVELWGQDCLRLFAFSQADWAVNSFRSDATAQAFFMSLVCTFKPKKKTGGSLLERAKISR